MTKLLRKYNKWLLAIFGTFLMLTFLVSPGTCSEANPAQRTVATLAGGKVKAGDILRAGNEFRAISTLTNDFPQRVMGVTNPEHWYLLTKEVEGMGLAGSASDGEQWIPELAELLVDDQLRRARFNDPEFRKTMLENARQQVPLMLGQAASQNNLTLDGAHLALAKFRGMFRLFELDATQARFSEQRMIRVARTRLDTFIADVVFLRGGDYANAQPPPTEEEIQSHFDKHRNAQPGEGLFGFGYVLPTRVKLEWMTLDKTALANSVTIDPIEANKAYLQDRKKYPGEYAAERDRVASDLKERKVADILAVADRAVRNAIKAQLRDLPLIDGVRKLPADWESKRPTMAALAALVASEVRSATGVPIDTPAVSVRADEWVRTPRASELLGIGTSRAALGSRTLDLRTLLESTRELRNDTALGLQVGVPFEGFTQDPSGNRYYFTVLAVKDKGPAENLAEVRADVIRDLRELRAFEALQAQREQLAQLAASSGLAEVVKQRSPGRNTEASPLAVLPGLRFSATDSDPRAGVGAEPLREAVVNQYRTIGVMTPATRENMALRTVSAAIPAQRTVAVAQLIGTDPLTSETVRGIQRNAASSLARLEFEAIKGQGASDEQSYAPYSFEALKQRLGYKARGEDAGS